MHRSARIFLIVLACVVSVQALAQPTTRRIRGEITAVEGTQIQVKTRLGENVTIALDPGYGVSAVVLPRACP